MNTRELIDSLNLNILVEGDDLNREVSDVYIGDLLSWVMGRAPADCAWLTVMGNINSIAVASLADVSCIILVEDSALDNDAKAKAELQGITILSTSLNSYRLALAISDLLRK